MFKSILRRVVFEFRSNLMFWKSLCNASLVLVFIFHAYFCFNWWSQMNPEEVLGWDESIRKRWRWNQSWCFLSVFLRFHHHKHHKNVTTITTITKVISSPCKHSFSMSFHHMSPCFFSFSMVFTIFLIFLWFSHGFPLVFTIFPWFSYGFPMFFPDSAPSSAPDSCRTRGASAWKPVIRWRPTRRALFGRAADPWVDIERLPKIMKNPLNRWLMIVDYDD